MTRTPFFKAVTGLVATALTVWSCQAPGAMPVGTAGAAAGPGLAGGFAIDRVSTLDHLAGKVGRDWTTSLVGGAERFGRSAVRAEQKRQLQALGDVVAAWSNGGKPGVPLSALGCSGTDKATNGAAARYDGTKRILVITREGKFLDLDPLNPTSGAVVTNLDNSAASTFTKTYVTLAMTPNVAFVVSDEGNAFAIGLDQVSGGAHPVKRVSLGQGACVGTALWLDPITSVDDSYLYAVANNGYAVRATFQRGNGAFPSSSFTASTVAKVTGITSSVPGFTGSELVKAAPVVLDGTIFVGDRRGFLNRYQGGTLKSWQINAGWPIETPVAVDVDDDLNPLDVFVAAGPKLSWVNLATNAIRHGQNALVEKGGPSGTITPDTITSFLDTQEQTLQTDWNNKDAFSVYATNQPNTTLPGAPGPVDINWLSYGEKVTGQSPVINALWGAQGQTAARVPEGTAANAVKFNEPFGLEFDSQDGSVYVANRQASQVIVKPNSGATVGVWTGLPYAVDPNRFYEIAGVNDGSNYNYGNRGTATNTRQTRLNKVRDVAVGNKGMYVAVGNDSWQTGALLFLPKNGVTNAFGWNVQTLNLYVLSRNCDPTAVVVDRSNPAKDVVYYTNSYNIGAPYARTVMKMDSSSAADGVVVTNSGLDDPTDLALDNQGNILIADPSGTPEVKMHYMGGSNKWGLTGTLTPNTTYTIVPGSANLSVWNLAFGANDPQSPGGCLYMGSTQWGSYPNAIYRLDKDGNRILLGGTPQSAGSTGDGGFATAAKLNAPRGLATDGLGNLYIADTGNQRIRKLTIPSYVGPEVKGYMRFNAASYLNRPILSALLTMTTRLKAKLPPPLVGVASPYLAGSTTTGWTADTMVQGQAPEIDTNGGAGTPTSPALSGGLWDLNPDTKVTYAIPPGAFPAGKAAGGPTDYLAVGIVTPADANEYYYPTSLDVPASSPRAFAFHTPRSDTSKRPELKIRYGSTYVTRPILSPPAILGVGANRYVFIANGNSLFRYKANTSSPASFSGELDFTYGRVMRYYSDGAKTYNPNTSFQPNAAPPLVDEDGRVTTLDVRYQDWNTKAYYALNAFNGAAGGSNMAIGGSGTFADVTPMGVYNEDVPSTADDNAGTYIVADELMQYAYFGLANGRLYRMALR